MKVYITDNSGINISEINPYRYRGYRYDNETGWYYLNSRYYNPEISRFINADGLIGKTGDILGHNLYSYCQNNPVMMVDSSGYWSWNKFWKGAAATVVAVAVVTAIVVTAPVSLPVAALAVAATATTGAALTYGYAEEETIVMDASYNFSTPFKKFNVKGGLSFVVDFEGGNIELYGHGGGSTGIGSGFSYSVGKVENYSGKDSYGGDFLNVGGGFGIGYDHCYDPNKPWDKALKANSLTFSMGGGVYQGYDNYFSIFHYNWRD